MKKIVLLATIMLVCPSFLMLGLNMKDLTLTSSNPATSEGYITVTGRWWYRLNGEYFLPIVWATVYIYDVEPSGSLVFLDDAFTDPNGDFSSDPILNDDGPGEDGLDIIVYVYTASSVAWVIDPDDYVYNASSPEYSDCPDGLLPIGNQFVPFDERRGAWRIFSIDFGLTHGWYYLMDEVGYDTPTALCYWPIEGNPRYIHENRVILLPNGSEWFQDVILHEYGHYVMHSVYEWYFPENITEYEIDKHSNANVSWVEGWAYFFPLAVKNNPLFVPLDINFEDKIWCTPNWDDGDDVVGRVAGALWDMFDSQNDSDPWYYDSFSDGFHRIWNITRDETPDTFQQFWDAWNATYYTHPKSPSSPYDLQDWTGTLMAIFQNSIDYRGPGDVNADGRVRVDDVLYVAQRFGQNKGDQEWDKRADFVVPYPGGDDKIQVDDVQFVAANFGKNYDC